MTEQDVADSLADQLLRRTPKRPFVSESLIDGVDFKSVTLSGAFPQTKLAVLFTSAKRPGMLFGVRFRLYSQLGEIDPLHWADVALLELNDSHGLPETRSCRPDSDGVVWLQELGRD